MSTSAQNSTSSSGSYLTRLTDQPDAAVSGTLADCAVDPEFDEVEAWEVEHYGPVCEPLPADLGESGRAIPLSCTRNEGVFQ